MHTRAATIRPGGDQPLGQRRERGDARAESEATKTGGRMAEDRHDGLGKVNGL